MLTMHPTVLIGPADWDPQRMPKEEFLARLNALWAACPNAGGAIVYGGPRHHAELFYLTNMMPKLESCLAFIPKLGNPRLLFGGGPNMVGSVRPLTWIEDFAPLRGAAEAARKWIETLDSAPVLIGGDAMPAPLRRALDKAAGPLVDATENLRRLMQRQSPREMSTLGEACAILGDASKALHEAWQDGAGLTASLLAAEHAALRSGVQDVRSLFSLDGGRTLRPFESLIDDHCDPLQVYVAVRHRGYWMDGFMFRSQSPHPLAVRTLEALRRVMDAFTPEMTNEDVARFQRETLKPYDLHPLIINTAVRDLGLLFDEADSLTGIRNTTSTAADRYVAINVGATDKDRQHAIMSALIAVRGRNCEVVWSSADF